MECIRDNDNSWGYDKSATNSWGYVYSSKRRIIDDRIEKSLKGRRIGHNLR